VSSFQSDAARSITFNYPTNFTVYYLSSESLGWLYVSIQIHKVMAIMSISTLAQLQPPTSASCIWVTRSHWEYFGVVRPESQGGQIPQLTGPMQWPSGASAIAGDKWARPYELCCQPGEHLGIQATDLGLLENTGDNPGSTSNCYRVVWENHHLLGNTAVAPRNDSYHVLFHNGAISWRLFVFSSMYWCIEVSIKLSMYTR